ncbi:hypothetical protein HPP92_005821 [Vanilla planifolia]|uniref:Uncharacterized protein n=1 Tax=Vanilla planifolia TaxID=51239 RepID=A0A835RUM7_VANPL|nr:hypothetical protein HPP92_005821 [Vanilla planifolia]
MAASANVNAVVNVIASYQQQNHQRLLLDVPRGRAEASRGGCVANGLFRVVQSSKMVGSRATGEMTNNVKIELTKMLLQEGQGHLFAHWAELGVDDDKKRAFDQGSFRRRSKFGDDNFVKLEEEGVKEAKKAAFVLEKVACLDDNDARIALESNDKYKIQSGRSFWRHDKGSMRP